MAALSSQGRLHVSAPQHVHLQDRGGVHKQVPLSSVASTWTTSVARVTSGSTGVGSNTGLPVLSALTAAPIAFARRSRRQGVQRCKTGVAQKGVEDSGEEQRGQWEMISKVTSANDSDELDGFIVPSQRKARKTKGSTSSSSSRVAPSRPARQAAPTSNGTHSPSAPVEQLSNNDNPPSSSSAQPAAAGGGGGWWKPVAGGQTAAKKSQRSLDLEKEVSVSDFAENAGTPLMRKGVQVKMVKAPTPDGADATGDNDDTDEDELASFINPSVRSGRNASRKSRATRRPRTSMPPANGSKPVAQEQATSAITAEAPIPASEPSSSSNAPVPSQGWWKPVDGGYGRAAMSQRTLNLEKEVAIADFADNVDPLIIQSRRNTEVAQPARSSVEEVLKPTESEGKEEEVAKQPAEVNGLPNLLNMTELERADLVDAHTRRAMKLLEEGKEKEAMAAFDSLNRIVALFQKVAAPEKDAAAKAKSTQEKLANEVQQGDVDEIYLRWRQELHEDDFSEIFGSKAWNSRWIGGML